MKKLTPKQRAKAYLKVSKKVQEGDYACYLLEKTAKINREYNNFSWMLKTYFPEFILFKPLEDTESWQVWFSEHQDRINALLLSYYMALDAKE